MTNLLALLPIFSFLALFSNFFLLGRCWKPISDDWRLSFLFASIIWALWVVFSVELLSLWYGLDGSTAIILWVIFLFANSIIFLVLNKKAPFQRKELKFPLLSGLDWLLIAGIVIYILIELAIAVYAPITNHDSMTYHMPRVMHWIQNQSVDFYPTADLRQLFMPPWAEYSILVFQILTGGDHFANLIQWFCAIGCAIGISLITKEMEGNIRLQIASAVFAITTPIVILQSTNTQNDLVVAFWLVCFVLFLLRIRTEKTLINYVAAGSSLGLAFLTKGTAFIFAFPWLVWWLITSLYNKPIDLRNTLLKTILMGSLALMITSAFFVRNFNLSRRLTGPSEYEGYGFFNQRFTADILAANLVRNIGINLGTPWETVNQSIENNIYRVFSTDLNHPDSTWPGQIFKVGYKFHEDLSSNPAHMLLILCSYLFFPLSKKLRTDSKWVGYILALASMFLLFSWLLLWQPWHTRLQLPFFILAAPVVVIITNQLVPKSLVTILSLILFLLSLPWLFSNVHRPIDSPKNVFNQPRIDQYFVARQNYQEPYNEIIDLICDSGADEVGLILYQDIWEYPIWILARERCNRPIRFQHVNVTNISAVLLTKNFKPRALIARWEDNKIKVNNQIFRISKNTPNGFFLRVYFP